MKDLINLVLDKELGHSQINGQAYFFVNRSNDLPFKMMKSSHFNAEVKMHLIKLLFRHILILCDGNT